MQMHATCTTAFTLKASIEEHGCMWFAHSCCYPCKANSCHMSQHYFSSLPLKILFISDWLMNCTATTSPMVLLQSLGWPCSLLLVQQKTSRNQPTSRPSMRTKFVFFCIIDLLNHPLQKSCITY